VYRNQPLFLALNLVTAREGLKNPLKMFAVTLGIGRCRRATLGKLL